MSARKVAIVTGSGTGVGAASALALAAQGYDVLINYSKSEAEAEASAAACRNAGADTLLMRGDVADDASCRGMAQAVVDRWGRLDALVNNAGVTSFAGAANWDAIDVDTFQHVVGVNALGTFQMIRACAPHLKAARGSIVTGPATSSAIVAIAIGTEAAMRAFSLANPSAPSRFSNQPVPT